MTATTTDMTVTIDGAIRQQPELLAKVQEATRFFEQEYQRRIPLEGQLEPTRLSWSLTRGRDGRELVHLSCLERDEYGERDFSEEPFPVSSFLFDATNRESMMYRALGTVVHLRGRAVHGRAEAMLRELEREEEIGHTN